MLARLPPANLGRTRDSCGNLHETISNMAWLFQSHSTSQYKATNHLTFEEVRGLFNMKYPPAGCRTLEG